jgi:hypothetical protein
MLSSTMRHNALINNERRAHANKVHNLLQSLKMIRQTGGGSPRRFPSQLSSTMREDACQQGTYFTVVTEGVAGEAGGGVQAQEGCPQIFSSIMREELMPTRYISYCSH